MVFLKHNHPENTSLLILTITAFYIIQLPLCYATNLLILKLKKHLFPFPAILLQFFLQLKSALSHQNASKIHWSWKTLKCFKSSSAHKAYSTLSQKMRNCFSLYLAKLPHLVGNKNRANYICKIEIYLQILRYYINLFFLSWSEHSKYSDDLFIYLISY